jgi:hypothetical protein
MMSLEDERDEELGTRVWEEASSIFRQEINANIVIIVGVGVDQLKEVAQSVNFTISLILISTISLEDKHTLSATHDRSFLDLENSYTDKYSQDYLEYFYSNLFSRQEVGKCHQRAFGVASENIQSQSAGSNKTYWCCCLHSHHPTCGWSKIVRRIGETEAHRLFKHDEWPPKPKEFAFRQQIQSLLVGPGVAICNQDDTSCCYKLNGRTENPKAYHGNLKEMIVWNGCEPSEIFPHLQTDQEWANKFDCDQNEKPGGRRCPLTIRHVM